MPGKFYHHQQNTKSWNFWTNVGEHPSGAAKHIQNLCQGTLKRFWRLIVAQIPAKTLTIDVSFFLAALFPTLAHLSPYLLPPSSPCLSCDWTSWRGHICMSESVGMFLLYSKVCADSCVNNLWAGVKLRKVEQDCKCLFSAESPTLFTFIKLSFFPSIRAAMKTIHPYVYLKEHVS